MRKEHLKYCTVAVTALVCILGASQEARAWGSTAHRIINLGAASHLPDQMGLLKADSLFYAAHASDPDYRKNSQDTSFYAEAQRHFIDIDAYPDFHLLPRNLDSLIAIYGRQTVWTRGTNPWATVMVFDSLVGQLRRGAMAKAESTMSDLGHYVADAHQPLHCTQNYDGAMTGNNGIHSRYETGMINAFAAEIVIRPDSVRYVSSPIDFIFDYIYQANALVDSVLAGDTQAKAVSAWNGSGSVPPAYYAALWQATAGFTENQIQSATVAVASLWYTAWVNAGLATSVRDLAQELPRGFRLEQNYPNPFNPTTTIQYNIGGVVAYANVRLVVYDILGREVRTLVNQQKAPGTYDVSFDGAGLSSGVYICRLTAGDFTETRWMVLLK